MPDKITVWLPREQFSTLADGVIKTWVIDHDGVPVPYTPCFYTHSHTRYWCGNPQCRDS